MEEQLIAFTVSFNACALSRLKKNRTKLPLIKIPKKFQVRLRSSRDLQVYPIRSPDPEAAACLETTKYLKVGRPHGVIL